jgi:uncharacterized protein YdhG (YjbR/CyaY superfamily)
MTDKPDGSAIDEFIAAQEERFHEPLRQLRSIISSEAPGAEERISYQVPTFRYQHYMLVGFGVTRSACSFYTMSPNLVKRMASELEGHDYSGSTVHFPPDQPLPEELIRTIVRARVRENRERAAAKGKKKE